MSVGKPSAILNVNPDTDGIENTNHNFNITTNMTITTFEEYRDACNRTMLPSCNNNDYLAMGLIEEIGELAKLVAKSIRGDYDFESVQYDALHECGDIAYMLMELGVLNGLGMPNVDGIATIEAFDIEAMHPQYDRVVSIERLSGFATELIMGIRLNLEQSITESSQSYAWQFIAVCCHACGGSLKMVLNLNNRKLAKRLAKGCIMGDGDHREEPDAPYCGCDTNEA